MRAAQAVGETGLGKTSLLSSLFRTELIWPDAPGSVTTKVVEQTIGFDLEGVPFTANLIDTPARPARPLPTCATLARQHPQPCRSARLLMPSTTRGVVAGAAGIWRHRLRP
jgi:hypothetical protein